MDSLHIPTYGYTRWTRHIIRVHIARSILPAHESLASLVTTNSLNNIRSFYICIIALRSAILRCTPCMIAICIWCMMTSSNGNIFRDTGHLCGEFTGHRWIPHTLASDAELWFFLWSEWMVELTIVKLQLNCKLQSINKWIICQN